MQKSAEKCRKERKSLVLSLLVLILCVAVFSGTALAVTGITSDLTQTFGNVPVIVINQGETFSVTFTAQNPIGTVTWYLGGTYSSEDVRLSPTTGNTTTVSGTLTQYSVQGYNVDRYFIAVTAYDDGGNSFDNVQAGYSFMVMDSSPYGNETPGDNAVPENNSEPSPSPVTPPAPPAELEIAAITSVPDLSPDIIARLAQNISVDPSQIILLTSADFNPSDPPEPTQTMRQEVSSQNGQFMAKLNTVKVSKDGWYVFMVTVSDDLVGTPVSDLRLFGAEDSDFTASFGPMSIFNGVTGMWEISNLFGIKIDTLPKQFLTTVLLTAGKSLTTYFVKILLMLLAGGCTVGAGAACIAVAGIIALKLFRKHRN